MSEKDILWVRGANENWLKKLCDTGKFKVENLDLYSLEDFLEKAITNNRPKAILFFLERDGYDLSGIEWGLKLRFNYVHQLKGKIPIIYIACSCLNDICKRYPRANFIQSPGTYFLERPFTSKELNLLLEIVTDIKNEEVYKLKYFAQAEIHYLNETLAHQMKNRLGALVLIKALLIDNIVAKTSEFSSNKLQEEENEFLNKIADEITKESNKKNNHNLQQIKNLIGDLKVDNEIIWSAYSFLYEIKIKKDGLRLRKISHVARPNISKILFIDDQAEKGQWLYALRAIFGINNVDVWFPSAGKTWKNFSHDNLDQYDFILLDLWLEKHDEEESSFRYDQRNTASSIILKYIKKTAPQVPVLIFSAYDRSSNYQKMLNMGAFDLFPKPGIAELIDDRLCHNSFTIFIEKVWEIMEYNKLRTFYSQQIQINNNYKIQEGVKQYVRTLLGISHEKTISRIKQNITVMMREAWFILAKARISRADLFNFFTKIYLVMEECKKIKNFKPRDPRYLLVKRLRAISVHTEKFAYTPAQTFLHYYDAVISYYFLLELLTNPQKSIFYKMDFTYLSQMAGISSNIKQEIMANKNEKYMDSFSLYPSGVFFAYVIFYNDMSKKKISHQGVEKSTNKQNMQKFIDKRFNHVTLGFKKQKPYLRLNENILSCFASQTNTSSKNYSYWQEHPQLKWHSQKESKISYLDLSFNLGSWENIPASIENSSQEMKIKVKYTKEDGFKLTDLMPVKSNL